MRRSTILLSIAAVLVLSAGVVVGRLWTRLPASVVVPPHADHDRGWFQDTLALTPDQRKNMDGIWADVKQQVDKINDRRHAIDKDRDAAIRALMTPEQLAAYDKIFADVHAKHSDLDKERETLFHSANDHSRALLTADQQVKWDAMQKDMHDHEHHGPGGMGNGPGGPGRMRNGSTTQPAGAASVPSKPM
jgi:cell division protein ZapA (FtsZ GTPase activity inhibitor)